MKDKPRVLPLRDCSCPCVCPSSHSKMSTTPPPARRTRRQGSAESTPVGLKGKLKIGKYIMGDTLGKERGVGWGEGEGWGAVG